VSLQEQTEKEDIQKQKRLCNGLTTSGRPLLTCRVCSAAVLRTAA